MPQTRTILLDLSDYATGSYALPETNVPNWVNRITFEIARCTTLTPDTWPDPASVVKLDTEASVDDGATWFASGGLSALGGIHVRKDLTEAVSSFGISSFTVGNKRVIRGVLEIVGGPIKTSLTVVIES
jgi:hypothetical protein